MATRLRTAAINPKLGVTPPSIRPLHNSTRCAPPRSAAIADATESAQTSSRTGSFIRLLLDHPDELRRNGNHRSLMAGMTVLNVLGSGVGGAPHDLARGTEIN